MTDMVCARLCECVYTMERDRRYVHALSTSIDLTFFFFSILVQGQPLDFSPPTSDQGHF